MLDRIVFAGAGHTIESILSNVVHLAPVIVLDTMQSALDELQLEPEPAAAAANEPSQRHAVVKRLGDATSRFVLEEAREDPRYSVALVAATGNDRRNIEVCRLARELGFQPIVGIVHDPATTADYERHGVRVVVRAQILGHVVEQALRYDGLLIASTVGQGRGEIIEFVVLPSSPAVGVPLSQLQAEGWRIAAIYRGSELVIPTGETRIAAEDRVLLIGQPDILPSVAEQLRIGVPQFPLRHGNFVVAYLPSGRKTAVEKEAEMLTHMTRAAGLMRVFPDAKPDKSLVDSKDPSSSGVTPLTRTKSFEDLPQEGKREGDQLAHLRRLRPGVVVTSKPHRKLWNTLFGGGTTAATLANALSCPVLFARGGERYTRLIYAMTPGITETHLIDTTIDLTRMLQLPLLVVRVVLPQYLESSDRQTEQVAAELDRRGRLYGIRVERVEPEGNPVRELMRLVQEGDLLIMARKNSTRDSFTSPDIAMRVAARARCSVLVYTVST